MAILRNGVAVDYRLLHNGVELDKATYDGSVELWVKATPYTVVFTDYPLTEGESGNYTDKAVITNATGYILRVKKKTDTVAFGYVNASVTYPTQKCNRVKVKYSTGEYTVASINGTTLDKNAINKEIVLECTGTEFTLNLYVYDETAYFLSELTIKEITFYYVSA